MIGPIPQLGFLGIHLHQLVPTYTPKNLALEHQGGHPGIRMTTPNRIDAALASWPDDESDLPVSVRRALAGWRRVGLVEIDPAIALLRSDPNAPYSTPRRATKEVKCRTLVLNAVAAPNGSTPLPADLATLGMGNPSPTANSPPVSDLQQEIAELKSALAAVQRHQSETDASDVRADYDIHEEVIRRIPESFGSFLTLTKKSRQQLLRAHLGSYGEGTWPNRLSLAESTKNMAEVKRAPKVSLVQFAAEVSKLMDRNDFTSKMAGTTLSRTIDLREQIEERQRVDPAVSIPAEDLLPLLATIEECADASLSLGLDMSAHLRFAVSHRIDQCIGIDHLREDHTKRPTDDFMGADTHKVVETAAKQKQNLTWAKEGHFPGSRVGNFFGQPPPNSSGGGRQQRGTSRGRGRSRGRGNARGRGSSRGRGRGRGKGNGDAQDSSATPP